MSKTLIIVESPAKSHKIQEYLGDDYIVMASYGHIADLAKGKKHGIGIDIENNFKPRYVLMDDKINVLDNLMKAAQVCDSIMLFSDPDREGEAISWHLAKRLEDMGKPIRRGVFNEIKKSKILKAIQNLRDVDQNLVNAQEARRILDRIVGFTISPFLMNTFKSPSLSGGRVQSCVTKMIIDREREIEQFVPQDFFTIQVSLNNGSDSFIAKYVNKLTDKKIAENVKNVLSNNDYVVSEVIAQDEVKNPQPPLVTSTLQRIMSKKYGFSADKTMKAAQSLYENGYCTYIRTDSVRVGDEALEEVRQWIGAKYNVPKKPYTYKNRESAQDAHECIRPTSISSILPWENYAMVDPDEKIVYEVIWRYFVASQMMPAVYNTLSVTAHPISDKKAKVKALGKALKDNGFLEILDVKDGSSIDIPNLSVGQKLLLDNNWPKLDKKQTQPPPRYSEDKLIKELVNRNIGRPSTYGELLSKVTARNYVEKIGNVFHATDLGKKITDVLNSNFTFVDYDFTSKFEKLLDDIAEGKANHIDVLKSFWSTYSAELFNAYSSQEGDKVLCDKCSNVTIKRNGKFGDFYTCVNPACNRIVNVKRIS